MKWNMVNVQVRYTADLKWADVEIGSEVCMTTDEEGLQMKRIFNMQA